MWKLIDILLPCKECGQMLIKVTKCHRICVACLLNIPDTKKNESQDPLSFVSLPSWVFYNSWTCVFCSPRISCPVNLCISWSSYTWDLCRTWASGTDTLGLAVLLETPSPWAKERSCTLVSPWPLLVKCPPTRFTDTLPATWMTGYSGQEKIALTSCDSGKANHIGTWPLNTQGAGSKLRGWLRAPLSSLVISWLLSWTSCPSFSDKLCLKEWWAVCH